VTSRTLSATILLTSTQLQFKVLVGFATAAGSAAILWAGAHEAIAGRVTVGDLLIFLAYLATLYGPIEALIYSPATIQGASGSARRVMEVLGRDQDIRDAADARSIARARGDVTFECVTFGYEAGRPVLQEISLEAKAGQCIAIVGPTGAGKSTMAGLLLRFFDPWSGRMLIDGQDFRSIKLSDLRRQVALVLQESFLFPRTIAENIAYGRPGATIEEIQAAAKAANAHGFVMELPKGYETVLGERGASLSGGQRQRLAIARALLKDAPVLILDEPTSALDAETEALLLDALGRLMKGRTTFIIAHRLTTIRNADLIVAIEQGRMVEAGTHAQLLERHGVYQRLYSASVAASADRAPTRD